MSNKDGQQEMSTSVHTPSLEHGDEITIVIEFVAMTALRMTTTRCSHHHVPSNARYV